MLLHRFAGPAAVAVLVLSVVTLLSSSAARAQPVVGNDISFPQCGDAFPGGQAFGIVGVNDGTPFSENPCLGVPSGESASQSELYWAWSTSSGADGNEPVAQLYVNTADPAGGANWPTSSSGQDPYGACSGANPTACAWQYGYNAAEQDADSWLSSAAASVNSMSSAGLPTTASGYDWWLDVETANTWQSGAQGIQMNIAVLRGMVFFLQHPDQGAPAPSVGVYSVQSMWDTITGGDTTDFTGQPDWVPGATDQASALSDCANDASFSGNTVVMIQWTTSYDYDQPCQTVPPPTPPASAGNGGGVVLQPNGAPSVFAVSSGGALLNYWYIPATGSWKSATVAPGGVTSVPSVQLQTNGAPTVFVQESGGSLWNYWYIPSEGRWGATEIAGRGVVSGPWAQIQPANGTPTVFVEGPGGSLLNYWYIPANGQWGVGTVASGGVTSAPSVQLQPNGMPTLFVEGPGGSLLNYWYIPANGQWGVGTVASDGVTSVPSVQLQPANGAPTVFVEGSGGSLLNYWYIPARGAWGAATVASGGIGSVSAVQLQPANGAPTIFVVGSGGSLLNYWYIPINGEWGSGTVAGTGAASQPEAQLQPANGAPTVFVLDTNGSLLNYWYIPIDGQWGVAQIASGLGTI